MSIVTTKQLRDVTGYSRPGDIEKCLEKQGVRFFNGKDGPWTTEALLNAAKGLVSLPQDQSETIL